jgi:hypothetical protein
MNHQLFLLIFLALSILSASCSKEVKYSKEELFSIARRADSSVSFVLPKSVNGGVKCSDYPQGCLSAHTVEIQKLELIAVEFQTEKQAEFAAKKVRGYYTRNWLLDDVTGEPVLERFVVDHLKAKKP